MNAYRDYYTGLLEARVSSFLSRDRALMVIKVLMLRAKSALGTPENFGLSPPDSMKMNAEVTDHLCGTSITAF